MLFSCFVFSYFQVQVQNYTKKLINKQVCKIINVSLDEKGFEMVYKGD